MRATVLLFPEGRHQVLNAPIHLCHDEGHIRLGWAWGCMGKNKEGGVPGWGEGEWGCKGGGGGGQGCLTGATTSNEGICRSAEACQ